MSAKVQCQVLDVGQGSGNFIEIYDSGAKLTSTILIDLGSELERETAGAAAAKYIVDTLNSMATPMIDAVILTHSDSDHINLLQVLLDNFDPPGGSGGKPVLKINRIFYGGDRKKYKKRSKNYLTTAAKYLTVDQITGLLNFPTNYTSYKEDTKQWDPFWTTEDVNFYLVAGNTTKDGVDLVEESETYVRKLPDGYAINTKSLVITILYKGVQMIVTGDATGLTLALCNQIIAKSGKLTNVFMATLPHHGSETTTFDLCGISTGTLDREEMAEQNLRDFVANIGAATVSGSAERVRTFKHPSARVIQFFWPSLSTSVYYSDPALTPAARHFYTAYFLKGFYNLDTGGMTEDWPPRAYWYTIQTAANIFTTLYFIADLQRGVILPPDPGKTATPITTDIPALGLQWNFGVTSAGAKSVTPITNRTILAARSPVPVYAPELGLGPVEETADAGPARITADRGELAPVWPPPFFGRSAPNRPAPPPVRGLKVIP
jgi:hypothetical protein